MSLLHAGKEDCEGSSASRNPVAMVMASPSVHQGLLFPHKFDLHCLFSFLVTAVD